MQVRNPKVINHDKRNAIFAIYSVHMLLSQIIIGSRLLHYDFYHLIIFIILQDHEIQSAC